MNISGCGDLLDLKPQIRPAAAGDFPALLDLERICFKEETFTRRQIRYLVFRAKSLVLVAVIENKIVGSVIIILRQHIASARIYSLNVHPQYRRMGIGSMLMDAAEAILRERGFKKMTLEVGVNNKAARNLYVRKGYFVDKFLKNYYMNGDDALHLSKKL